MRLIYFTDLAALDFIRIISRSASKFDKLASKRYERLIYQAISDLADNPARAGSIKRDAIEQGTVFYHLKHSKSHVTRSSGRVGEPRHFIVFRLPHPKQIQIVRILHERMHFRRQEYPR